MQILKQCSELKAITADQSEQGIDIHRIVNLNQVEIFLQDIICPIC